MVVWAIKVNYLEDLNKVYKRYIVWLELLVEGFYIKVVYLGRSIEGQFKNTWVVVINGHD